MTHGVSSERRSIHQSINPPAVCAGRLKCNGPNQEAVLSAAAAGGGGALLLVLRDSNHHSYDDILLLYGRMLQPLAQVFQFKMGLDPKQAMTAITWSMHAFLQKHLPGPSTPARAGSDLTDPGDVGPGTGMSAGGAAAGAAAMPLVPAHEHMYRERLGDDLIAILRMAVDAPSSR